MAALGNQVSRTDILVWVPQGLEKSVV